MAELIKITKGEGQWMFNDKPYNSFREGLLEHDGNRFHFDVFDAKLDQDEWDLFNRFLHQLDY